MNTTAHRGPPEGEQVESVRMSAGDPSNPVATRGQRCVVPTAERVRVAVINTSRETIELLRALLEEDGFEPVGGMDTTVTAFKRGERDLREYLTSADPRVIVWDIALPYVENWQFFRTCLERGDFDGRGIVLTTTNKYALDELVGPTPVHELLGKPFDDIEDLLKAIRQAVALAKPR
jgi:CheY-like chemotaxis protein